MITMPANGLFSNIKIYRIILLAVQLSIEQWEQQKKKGKRNFALPGKFNFIRFWLFRVFWSGKKINHLSFGNNKLKRRASTKIGIFRLGKNYQFSRKKKTNFLPIPIFTSLGLPSTINNVFFSTTGNTCQVIGKWKF